MPSTVHNSTRCQSDGSAFDGTPEDMPSSHFNIQHLHLKSIPDLKSTRESLGQ